MLRLAVRPCRVTEDHTLFGRLLPPNNANWKGLGSKLPFLVSIQTDLGVCSHKVQVRSMLGLGRTLLFCCPSASTGTRAQSGQTACPWLHGNFNPVPWVHSAPSLSNGLRFGLIGPFRMRPPSLLLRQPSRSSPPWVKAAAVELVLLCFIYLFLFFPF